MTARLPASGTNVCTTSAGGHPCPAVATSRPPSNPTCSAATSQPSSTTSGKLASPGEGQDHTGHGVDRFGVGQAVVDAQRPPGPERGGVADDRAQPTTVVLGPGGHIPKPRGELHTMWNAGPEPARMIEVISPAGFEHFFREMADLSAAGPPQLPEVVALAGRDGLQFGH